MSRSVPPKTTSTGGEDTDGKSEYRYTERPDEGRAVIIAFTWTVFLFKVFTSILILIFFPSEEAVIMVCALSIPWFIGIAWYFGAVGHVRLRLLRVRARRRKLIYEEWNVD